MIKPAHKNCLFLIPVLGASVTFAGCSETIERPPSSIPPAPQNQVSVERYVFMTETDKQRGEVVKIFDQQTGDYWIKWVGSDPKQGKVYSVWNYFPLEGTPESGVTEIKTVSVDTGSSNGENPPGTDKSTKESTQEIPKNPTQNATQGTASPKSE